MGQKVQPIGLRLGIVKDWTAKWYGNKQQYADFLTTDMKVREFIEKKLANAAISKVVIERPSQNMNVTLYTARPGIVIGKKGEDIEKLRKELGGIAGMPVQVAESIAQQLEKRVMFRRAMKRAMQNTMRLGAEGVKIMIAGRLNGAEIARTEWVRDGRVPLHTLRADIDYGTAEASTTYGIIGIKVWIFKGEVQPADDSEATATAATGA
jgi:small subunit ribosomal protein S3